MAAHSSSRRRRQEADTIGSGIAMGTALLEQRMRAEEYRTNFESLKAQHMKLQQDYEELLSEKEELSKQYHHVADHSEQIIAELQQERDKKINECEELRAKSLTPHKLRAVREEITQEVHDTLRKELNVLEAELNTMREEHHKLQYSYQFLKSEYSTAKTNYESAIDEMKSRYKAELVHCANEVKELRSRMERDTPTELIRIRELQKANAELQERLTLLVAENDELRAEHEHTQTTGEQGALEVRREVMELQASLQGLQLEKCSLQEQLSSARSQLDSSQHQQQSLSEQLSQAQRQVSSLKRKTDELQHRHHKEMGESRMKHQHELGELQREKEKVMEEVEVMQTQCATLQQTVEQLKTTLADEEGQIESLKQTQLQNEWGKTMELEKNRLELEDQLAEAQRNVTAMRQENEEWKRKCEEQATQHDTIRGHSEAQLKMVRGQLTESTSKCRQQEKEIAELTVKFKELCKEHDQLIHSEQTHHDDVDQLGCSLRNAEHLITSLQQEVAQLTDTHKEELCKLSSEREEERAAWNTRVKELSDQLTIMTDNLAQTHKARKKANKHHKSSIEEMHRALDLAHDKEKELLIEREKEKRQATEDIKSLRKQLQSVKRQQQHFMLLLNSSPDTVHLMESIETTLPLPPPP